MDLNEQVFTQITGNASGWKDLEFTYVANTSRGGRLKELIVRSTGLASAVDIYGVHSEVALAAAPDQNTCFYVNEAQALVASATVPSLIDDMTLSSSQFRPGVTKRFAFKVTATGAYTLDVVARYEMHGG